MGDIERMGTGVNHGIFMAKIAAEGHFREPLIDPGVLHAMEGALANQARKCLVRGGQRLGLCSRCLNHARVALFRPSLYYGMISALTGSFCVAALMRQRQFQLNTTLPDLPDSIRSKPCWKSSIGNWWLSTLPSGKPDSTSCVILYQVSYILRP